MLINPLRLSNYLAPSSWCWADVCGEVSAALPALLRDSAAQHFPRTGQVMGWERHPQSLGRGWEEKAMNWFSPLCCLIQGLPQSVTGQTGKYGKLPLPSRQGLGPPGQGFMGRVRLAASSTLRVQRERTVFHPAHPKIRAE